MKKIARALLLLALLSVLPGKINTVPAHAAGTWVVTNTSDAGAGSLRHAVENSVAGDTINFDASLSGQTIITTGILIDHDLTIDGSSLASHVKISGNNLNWSFIAPLCTIQAGCLVPATVTINGLDIINGGIINQMSGTLYISNVNFIGNHVSEYEMGGAITNRGFLSVSNSTFSDNTSTFGPGAIYSKGTPQTMIAYSSFTNNQGYLGGAIYSTKPLSIYESGFSNNQALSGGAVYAAGNLDITRSQFTGNHAVYQGGGVYANYTVGVNKSTFSGNTAAAGGGAIYKITSVPASMWIENSTIYNNSNTGVFNEGGPLHVIHSTIVGNSTTNNAQGSGIYGYSTLNPPETIEILNSIIAGNTGAPDCYIQGLDFLGGSNLIQNNAAGANACGVPSLTAPPQLGPLQDNGGPTLTLKPQPGSPVVDSSDNVSCSYDQRSFPRKQDGDGNGSALCDIGAVEVEASTVSAFSITRSSSNPNWETSVDFYIFFSEAVSGVDISDFTLTTSGDVTGASIASAVPDYPGPYGTGYVVTVNTGSGNGNGVIRLNIVDDNSIVDRDGNPLGGPLAGDGNFSGGEAYAMVPMDVTFSDQLFRTSNPPITITFPNTTAEDLNIGTLEVSGGASRAAPNTAKSFFIENDHCSGVTLPPSQSCTFQVRFLPWSLGAKSGRVVIRYPPFAGYGISFSGNSIPGSQLLSNRSFDAFSPSTQQPDLWEFGGLKPGLDVVDPAWAFHGPMSFKFVGDGTLKIISQTINKSGAPGDDFSFSVMTKGSAIPANSQRWLMQVMFLNNGVTVENRNVLLPTGTFNNLRLSRTYTARSSYDQILFRIHYAKNSGTAWVDLASLQWAP